MKQRLLSLLLAVVMILALLPVQAFAADPENPFRDVKQGDWCYEAVQYARVNGFFNGTTHTTFTPDGTMTRGMFVTVLGRLAGVDAARYQGKPAFTDVPEDAYFAPYVAWASAHGITAGTGDGRFSPYAYINRQQMAAFFVRYFEAFGVDYATGREVATTPADLDLVSPYARDAVSKLWRQGLLNGDGVNFNPAGNATRAQTATVCWRLDRIVETWYKEPGVPSGRVKLDPATGLPYGGEEKKPLPIWGGGGSGSSGGSGESHTPEPAPSDRYSVRFYDGSRLIDSFNVKKDQPLGKVPSVEKSSKAGAVLAGWYTDPGFTQPFYADDPVPRDTSVYARYEDLEETEEAYTPVSFARMDQSPDLSFRIKRVSGGVEPRRAAELKVMDGSSPVELSVIQEVAPAPDNPDASAPEAPLCTVKGNPGFNEGCTYELTLAEGWVFVDETTGEERPESIRTATFSIKMEEVHNLRMNSAIQYVRDGGEGSPEDLTFTINGTSYDALNSEAVHALGDGSGSFAYADANALHAGDILCVHEGLRPEDRRTGEEANAPAAYVKVLNAGSGTVTFGALDGEQQQNLYEIPDNFPILLDHVEGNTVSIGNLDTELYAIMMGARDGTLENARKRLSVGDFVTLYTAEGLGRQEVVYGRVDRVDGGVITYTPTTEDALLHSMDLYDQLETADGGEWVSPELQEELEAQIQAQVEQSGFAREAAGLLEDLVTRTDGFRENVTVQQYLLHDSGRSGGLPGFTLANRPKVTVKILTRGSQLHFNGGVQVRVTVEAKYRTPVGQSSDDFLVIDLEGSFVEEVALSPTVKGGLVYKKLLGFLPVPNGVRLNATIDVKNYSALDFDAEISTTDRNGLIKGEKSRITSELEAMGETSSNAEYQESLSRLMERYTEVVTKDSDWITLLEKKFLDQEKNVYGFCFGVKGYVTLQADMSVALGSSLEYETGKRYIFWFRVGLFTPTSGSGVTDLVDERFAFQFYVMGKLGVRVGVKVKIYAGLGTEDFASAGLTAEMGPYVKLYGFFIYTCNKYRPAGSALASKRELMAGALDTELGMYFSVGYEAVALKIFTYSGDFETWEIPILKSGASSFYYDCFYRPEPGESVRVYNNTGSAGGTVMRISDYARTLKSVTLKNGYRYWDTLPADRFFYSLSNSNFHLDTGTGELLLTVTPPEGVHYMKCDLTVTYKGGKMAFSTYDMTTTVPLVWTDLSDRELKEYYTASVRVGNDADGYNTVWTKRVLAGEEFDLPGEAEVRELAGWNELKYESGNGYGGQALENQVITRDTLFDYDAELRTYSVTVSNIRGGGSSSETYTAKYGESFDFSDLADTGGKFEKFTQVTTAMEVAADEDGTRQAMDLTRPIGPAMARALQGGGTAKANYVDDSVMARFAFTGVDLGDIEVQTRRGAEPETGAVEQAVGDAGDELGLPNLAIRDITPALGPIDADTNYDVDCVALTGARAELRFETGGGPEMPSMNRLAGSLVTNLPQPERMGYTFGGWYEAASCEGGVVQSLLLPEEGAVLYAKWTPNTYTVSFHVNGGDGNTPGSVTVSYGGEYGQLPTAKKTGQRFLGWFTAPDGGDQVQSGDPVTITGNQTLYAHWGALLRIGTNGDVFSVVSAASQPVYDGSDHGGLVSWSQNSGIVDSEGNPVPTGGYRFEFGGDGTIPTDSRPVNAGTYDLIISRPADDTYAEYRKVYDDVLTIQKADWETALWDTGKCRVKLAGSGSYIEVHLEGDCGIMLDEVKMGTIPEFELVGEYNGRLHCRLLCFMGISEYEDHVSEYVDGYGNFSGNLPCTVNLYIPDSRNYHGATILGGSYDRS